MSGKPRKSPVDRRIADLEDDFSELGSDLKGLAGEVGQAARTRASQAAGYATDEIEEWASDHLDDVRQAVARQPLKAVLMALGAGIVLGAILSR